MGKILRAICGTCGFERKNIGYGGGMENYKTFCGVPAIDVSKNQLVVENYFNKEKLEDNIVFYTEKQLFKGEIDKNNGSWSWMDVFLKIKENKCPECNNFTMTFESCGSF